LRNTNQPILSYVWRAWLIAGIPALFIAAIATGLGMTGGQLLDWPWRFRVPLWLWFLALLLIAPWTETLLMWPVLAILKRAIGKTVLVILASGLIFGILHCTYAPAWGAPQMWLFFVLSFCFLEWAKKSKGRAIVVTALVHTCHNAVCIFPLLLIVLFGVEFPVQKMVPLTSPPQAKALPPESWKLHWGPGVPQPGAMPPSPHLQAGDAQVSPRGQTEERPLRPDLPRLHWGK
jgi:hypothetical protein